MDLQSDAEGGASRTAGVDPKARVLVLGPLLIEHGGRTVHVAGTQRRRLLALFASRAGEVVGVDAIVDALWAEDPPPTAAKTIQSHVARLRASLAVIGRDLIETTPGGYRLAAASVDVDADAFEQLATEGHRRLASRDFTSAIGHLTDALVSWRGSPYSDFPDVDFAAHERTRLSELHAVAAEDLAEARLESGAASAVSADLERLVAVDPGRERAWGLLMRALYASGRQHEALVAFQRARRALADSYGLDPGPELQALERRVLEQDPGLTIAQRSDVPAVLRTGAEEGIGRQVERAWLSEAWDSGRRGRGQVRVVLGPPDSGRTRLAAAVAATAAGDHGAILYVRAADDLALLLGCKAGSPAAVVEAIAERSRRQPVLLIVDDVEWASASTMETLTVLAGAVELLAALLVLVADPSGGGPAVEGLDHLDPSGGRTLTLAPMSDDEIAHLVGVEGIDDPAAVAAIVSVAAGRPGVARREAAAWAEQAAGERLNRAAATSSGALAVADDARDSVVEEVARLVRARARRHQLTSAAWLGRQPYRGLSAYGPADVDVFVGRERLVAELAARVLDRRLVVVTGASGSGKSSLVRAGLVPLVQSGRLPGGTPWRVNVTVPGVDPLRALDTLAELDEPGPQLLVLDQFEEVFASARAVIDALVGRLLDLALDPALDAHVVLVVRADRYANLAEARHLTELVGDAHLVVGRPTDDELRRIVEEPAGRAGCRVEPALVATVLEDVGDADGTLPLVSTALAELWQQRDGDVLTAAGYRAAGGLAASVERLGDQMLEAGGGENNGSAAIEDAARRALLLLADVTDDGSWVRRRLHHTDIPADLGPTFDALVDGRLVVRAGDTVEIAHEIVFRAWPRLRDWLEHARTDLMLGHDVRVAARTWSDHGRADDDVYRGARLAATVEWCDRHPDSTTPQIAEFVAAGSRVADHDRLHAEAQLARERRAGRRLRRALVAASLLLALSLAAATLAIAASRRADNERDRANESADLADSEAAAAVREADRADREATAAVREADRADREAVAAVEAGQRADATALLADAERLGALAGLEADLDMSLLLAAQAYTMADTASTRGALLRAVERSPAAVGLVRSDGPRPQGLKLSPDGTLLAVRDNQGGITVYDATTSRPSRRYNGDSHGGVAWTPDGTAFVTLVPGAGHDPSDPEGFAYDAVVVDAVSFEERARYTGRAEDVSDLAFSPDGQLLVASPAINTRGHVPKVTIWDVTRPGPPARTVELPDGTQRDGVSFDASAEHVAVSVAGATVLIDVHTGDRVESFDGSGGLFSPDGRTLAVNAGPGAPLRLELVDVATGERRALQGAHSQPINSRAFSRDGTMLATSGDDRVVRVWDTATGRELWMLSGHSGRVTGSAFSADGDTLYSTSLDRSLITWDLAGRTTIERMITDADPAGIQSELSTVTSDGSAVVQIANQSDLLTAIDLGSGARAEPIDTRHGITFTLLPGVGNTVITGGYDGVIRRWDVSTGELLTERTLEGVGIFPLVLAPDQSVLYAQTYRGPVRALDPLTLDDVDREELDVGREILATAVSPDGRALAISTFDPPTIAIIDLESGASRSLAVTSDVPALAYSPDGTMLIAGDDDGRVMRVDPAQAALIGEPVLGHDGPVRNVAFSPDGHRFTSGSTDGTIGMWDTATGRDAGSVQPGPPNIETRARWAPDGHTLFVLYENGAVYSFDTRPESWLDRACRTAGRALSPTEWAKLLPDRPYEPAC